MHWFEVEMTLMMGNDTWLLGQKLWCTFLIILNQCLLHKSLFCSYMLRTIFLLKTEYCYKYCSCLLVKTFMHAYYVLDQIQNPIPSSIHSPLPPYHFSLLNPCILISLILLGAVCICNNIGITTGTSVSSYWTHFWNKWTPLSSAAIFCQYLLN